DEALFLYPIEHYCGNSVSVLHRICLIHKLCLLQICICGCNNSSSTSLPERGDAPSSKPQGFPFNLSRIDRYSVALCHIKYYKSEIRDRTVLDLAGSDPLFGNLTLFEKTKCRARGL